MNDVDSRQYYVLEQNGKHQVRDWNDRKVLTCGDADSASHYAVLLTQTYQLGFKEGYRAGKQAT